jgi:hypothetical protein
MAGLGCGAGEVSQCTSSKTVLIATIKTVRYTRNCMIARFFVPETKRLDGPRVPRRLDRGFLEPGNPPNQVE